MISYLISDLEGRPIFKSLDVLCLRAFRFEVRVVKFRSQTRKLWLQKKSKENLVSSEAFESAGFSMASQSNSSFSASRFRKQFLSGTQATK